MKSNLIFEYFTELQNASNNFKSILKYAPYDLVLKGWKHNLLNYSNQIERYLDDLLLNGPLNESNEKLIKLNILSKLDCFLDDNERFLTLYYSYNRKSKEKNLSFF